MPADEACDTHWCEGRITVHHDCICKHPTSLFYGIQNESAFYRNAQSGHQIQILHKRMSQLENIHFGNLLVQPHKGIKPTARATQRKLFLGSNWDRPIGPSGISWQSICTGTYHRLKGVVPIGRVPIGNFPFVRESVRMRNVDATVAI
jgi:hypothetical protein